MHYSETPFLNAIRANPLDGLPRLVFSDWLEENGDERYQWVRFAELFARMGDAIESPIPRLLEELETLRSATPRDDDPFPEEFVLDGAGIGRIRDLLILCGPAVVPSILERTGADRPWPPEYVSVAGEFPGALAERLPELRALQKSPLRWLSEAGSHLIVRAGEADAEALRPLLDSVRHRGEDGTERAFEFLGTARGAAVDAILAAWEAELGAELGESGLDNPDLTVAKFECLGRMKHDSPRVLPLFARAIGNPHGPLAAAGATGLAVFREQAQSIVGEAFRNATEGNVEAVIDLARSIWPDWRDRFLRMMADPALIRESRLGVLASLPGFDGPIWQRAIPAYAGSLRHADPIVRAAAAKALGRSSGPLDSVLSLLKHAYSDEHTDVRKAVLDAIYDRPLTTAVKVPPLIVGLGDPNASVANHARDIINRADLLRPALRELERRLEDREPAERAAAIRALGRICDLVPDGVSMLFRAVDDENLAVRRATIHVVAEIVRPGATGIQKRLRRALTDPDATIRQGAALAFGALKEESKGEIPELLEMARDESPRARAGAMKAMPSIDFQDRAVVRAVMRGLRDESDRVLLATLEGLSQVSISEPALQLRILESADHTDPAIRAAALFAFRYLDDDEPLLETVAAFRKGLADPVSRVSFAAFEAVQFNKKILPAVLAEVFAHFSKPSCTQRDTMAYSLSELPEAVPGLLGLLGSREVELRQRALGILLDACEKRPDDRPKIAEGVAPFLPKLLATERGERLRSVLQLAESLGTAAAASYPQVSALLDHTNNAIRKLAQSTIGRLGTVALPAAPRLQAVLGSPGRSSDRGSAAAGLLSLGAHDPVLLPEALAWFHEDGTDAREAFAIRCGLHPELGVHTAVHLLRSWSENERMAKHAIAKAMGKLGAAMEPHIAACCDLLVRETDDSRLREDLVEMFGSLGASASSALPTLVRCFRKEDHSQTRCAIVEAAGKIPGSGRLTILTEGLRDPDGTVREETGEAFQEIGLDAVAAIPEICKAILDPKWDNFHITVMKSLEMEPDPKGDIMNQIGIDRRQYLLWTLQGLKAEAAPAIPALQKLLDDRHEGVRAAAAAGLAAIGAPATAALKKAARHRDPDVKSIA